MRSPYGSNHLRESRQWFTFAPHLANAIGQEDVFYDRFHEAELARLDLDTYLQRIYHDESDLLVVFLCEAYEQKEWCCLEWRAIRNLIKTKQASSIMPIRVDEGDLTGLFSIDGYIDVRGRGPDEIAELILKRLEINAATANR